MFSTILHPTDLSDSCVSALRASYLLAKSLGANLQICYIAHPPLVASGNELTDPDTGQTRNILKEIEALQPLDPKVECEVKIVMLEKSATSKATLAILEKSGCDLIVLGMHEREGISGWWGSTITEEVVRRASCAVMVVKHDEGAADQDDPDATVDDVEPVQ